MLGQDSRMDGALAQLGARLNGIQKVVGSNPICSMDENPLKIPELHVNAGFSGIFYCI